MPDAPERVRLPCYVLSKFLTHRICEPSKGWVSTPKFGLSGYTTLATRTMVLQDSQYTARHTACVGRRKWSSKPRAWQSCRQDPIPTQDRRHTRNGDQRLKASPQLARPSPSHWKGMHAFQGGQTTPSIFLPSTNWSLKNAGKEQRPTHSWGGRQEAGFASLQTHLLQGSKEGLTSAGIKSKSEPWMQPLTSSSPVVCSVSLFESYLHPLCLASGPPPDSTGVAWQLVRRWDSC